MQSAAGEMPSEHLSSHSTFPTGTFVRGCCQPALECLSPRAVAAFSHPELAKTEPGSQQEGPPPASHMKIIKTHLPSPWLPPTSETTVNLPGRRRQGGFRGELAPRRSTLPAPHCPGGGGGKARRCRSAPAALLRRAGGRALARAYRPAAAAAAATEAAPGRADRELQMPPTPECGAPNPWCVSPAPREWRLNEDRGKGKTEALLPAEPPAGCRAVGHIAGAPAGELAGQHRSPHSPPRRGE